MWKDRILSDLEKHSSLQVSPTGKTKFQVTACWQICFGQSVEQAIPGEEVLGSIPAVPARALLVWLVSVYCDRLRQKSWSFRSCLVCGSTQKVSDISLGTRPRYSLVVEEDVKKPTNQTNKALACLQPWLYESCTSVFDSFLLKHPIKLFCSSCWQN